MPPPDPRTGANYQPPPPPPPAYQYYQPPRGVVHQGVRAGGIGCIALVVMALVAVVLLVGGCALLIGLGDNHTSTVIPLWP